MAKSEIRAIHVWQADENLVCQRAGRRENAFAISIKSIKSDEDPTSWLIGTFGERQIMAQPAARSLFIFPIDSQGFGIGCLLFAHGDFASAPLNHQKCR
jgi:hypothetical protein